MTGPRRDDKVHDSIIEERINRERPCRTLFIRNIKASSSDLSVCLASRREALSSYYFFENKQYETDSDDVRRKFDEHGEIKTFFDLIANRGMVFVTYVSCLLLRHRKKFANMFLLF